MPSRKTLVDQAITFQNPARIPLWFVNADQTAGDAMVYHLSLNKEDDSGDNEWGYHLEKLDDGTMGHPTSSHLPDWRSAEHFTRPPVREEDRMARLPAFLDECEDRYRLASLDLSGFTVYTLLRGFENSMRISWSSRTVRLADGSIVDFECEHDALAARRGFHGIHFADDWGTQNGLMISPAHVAPTVQAHYRRQFALAHELGLHTWYHCCGNFRDHGGFSRDRRGRAEHFAAERERPAAEVGRRLRGRQCFLMPISYQTVSISGTPAEIYAEAQRLYDIWLGTPSGGFIGYVEEYGVHGHVGGELPGLRRGLSAADLPGTATEKS